MKRLGNIWNDVINVDLAVQDIIDGTKYKRGKREVKSQSINSRIGWAKHCNSNNFIRNDIQPYVDINQTRKVVSVCGANQVTAKR